MRPAEAAAHAPSRHQSMSPSSAKGKILVIRGGAIGDFILTLPALAALRQQFPEAHLEVLGYPHIVQLAQAGGLVDKVQAIEARALAGFFARNGELAEQLRDYFAEFSIIISYLYDPDEIFKMNVARCSFGQFIVGPHRPNESECLHATKVFLKPLERLAIFEADPVPRLTLNLQPSTLNQLALHPGSGSERKNWPEAKWVELIARLLNSSGVNLLLVGGEAEGERLQRLAAALPPVRCSVAKSLPLAELAARLRSCAAFVGHDSGITHLASSLGVPTLALWGDTVEEIWRPLGERSTIVREAVGIGSISVERVMRELEVLLQPS
jgi:heptosyltransferase III